LCVRPAAHKNIFFEKIRERSMITTDFFKNKTLMITGGTGSFGSTVLKHFLDSELAEIRIFSRDEKKQDDMRHELQAKHPELGSLYDQRPGAAPALRLGSVCR